METDKEERRVQDQAIFRESILAKLDAFHECTGLLDRSFSEFKQGLGKRTDEQEQVIDRHTLQIDRLENSMALLLKVAWCIIGGAILQTIMVIFRAFK